MVVEQKVKSSTLWVVKIGGSLLGSAELERWLDLLVKFSDGHVVIVPGGGLFADAVREAQNRAQISDACAHRLSVLAMDQFGLLLANLNPLLATASTELEIAERTWQHRGIVWLPSNMVLNDDNIPQSWDVTSDSLSAWLADKLEAQHLVLVKSDKPADKNLSINKMIEDGVIDIAFKDFILNKTFSAWLVKKTDFIFFEKGVDETTLTKIGSLMV